MSDPGRIFPQKAMTHLTTPPKQRGRTRCIRNGRKRLGTLGCAGSCAAVGTSPGLAGGRRVHPLAAEAALLLSKSEGFLCSGQLFPQQLFLCVASSFPLQQTLCESLEESLGWQNTVPPCHLQSPDRRIPLGRERLATIVKSKSQVGLSHWGKWRSIVAGE